MVRAPCCDKNGQKKGPWTPEEDQKLLDYIQKNGYGNWRTLPKNAGLQRCGKSCRLRWTNYLRPDIKRGRFSFEEEETIIQLHSIVGNKWSAIAARLPGRTDNEIKNYWNTHIRKRLLRMGIDPVTHSPRLDLLDLSSILNTSLYNSSQMNISRLLGVQFQPQVNPELLRLASSLFSSDRENSNLFPQNVQQNQICNPDLVQSQLPPLVQHGHLQNSDQEILPCTASNTAYVSFSDETQFMQPNVEQFSSSFTNFNPQSYQLNEWESSGISSFVTENEDYGAVQQDYSFYTSDQSTVDHLPSENSTFQSNNSNNFSFQSVLSTPSSSPAPLNSNSTCINSCSNNEDERESYCSNMMKFEIPSVFDVNEFL
ncbi:unnamed protein product [Ilex paraguariensis]|uniref:Uncharacterized protein n=1 Tax=Ilex paraguariensis TaxID=185542 RepID=A0ABC8UJR9_9AQUA